MFQMSNLTPESFAPGADPQDSPRPRKRQRKVLSCDACHRQKVRCDRQQPCSRCVAGGRSEQCTYQGGNEPPAITSKPAAVTQQPSPAASDSTTSISTKTPRQPIGTVWRKGRARFSGLTHWAQLAFQFEEAAPFMRGDPRELANLMSKMKQLKAFYPPKRLRAFPLGDSGANSELSTHPRLSFLPPKALAEQLVENYLITFETLHPLLNLESFQNQFYHFWEHPDSASDGWLAQLYMMIALSCWATHDISFSAISGGHVGLSERCIDGAEAALLAKGLFMSKPDLTILRTLCMIAIAKRIDLVTLDDHEGLWTHMGFVTRVAMSMSLHIGTSAFPAMPEVEGHDRRRLWNTIMVLEAYAAVGSGMPMLLRPEDYDTYALSEHGSQSTPTIPRFSQSSIEENSSRQETPAYRTTSNAYQSLLAEAMPTLILILNRINSPSPGLDSDQLTTWDSSIRQLLQKAQTCLFSQRKLIEVLLLRCSMAIHQNKALAGDPRQDEQSSISLRALNESALGLVQIQKALWSRPSHRWLADLFHRDFGIAGLVVGVGLRNNTFSEMLGGPSLSRSAAWSAMRGNYAIMRENILRSKHYFKIFKAFSVLIGILEALEAGTSIRDAVYKAGLEVITTVEESVGRSLVIQSSENSFDPILTGEAGQLGVNFEPLTFALDDFINDFFW